MRKEDIQTIIKESTADYTEVFAHHEDLKLTRFAQSQIHQNISQDKKQLTIVVYKDKKKGSATTTDLSYSSMKKALEKALQASELQEPDPDFNDLPCPSEKAKNTEGFSKNTAGCSAEKRAEGVKLIRKIGNREGFDGYGTFSTQADRFISANSEGIFSEWETSQAYIKILYMDPKTGGEGFAQDVTVDVDDLNIEQVAERSSGKCAATRERKTLKPGEYTVILEPLAVCDLLGYLGFIGFNGLACHEGRSYFSGKIGEKVMSEDITLIDDPWDEHGLPQPYDGEGIRKEPIPLVEKGIYKHYVYDHYLARKEGKKTTGHALPPDFRSFGSMPMHLRMEPGNKSREELLESVDRGVLVTRFHYVGVIHPQKTIITGLTRDGTFWIENGKIKHALKNLRFTQSIIESFNRVQGIGNWLERMPFRLGAPQAPALLIDGFNITGVSEME